MNPLRKILAKLRRLVARRAFASAKTPRPTNHMDAGGPENERSLYWIGHSLMQETAKTVEGDVSLFRLMAKFTQAQKLHYQMFDHTLYGAPLSLQWRGETHGYDRKAPEMADKRRGFTLEVAKANTVVLTEVVPVLAVLQLEFSAYYLQQYLQSIESVNPQANVYLYESWDYFHQANWREAMNRQRAAWECLADTASQGMAIPPFLSGQLKTLLGFQKIEAASVKPVFIVPVGQAFVALYDCLKSPVAGDDFTLTNGETLQFYQLFKNTYVNWPESDGVPLRVHQPEQEVDDIHPSEIGIYLVALVHFATLYRRSPIGLPSLGVLGEALSLRLQKIAWQVVVDDTRSGVRA